MTDIQINEATNALERAAAALYAKRDAATLGPLGIDQVDATAEAIMREDALDDARTALEAAFDGNSLHTEIVAELFGGPDLKAPHMVQRPDETYMDFCDRIAGVAAAVVHAQITGSRA